jgi:nucleoside-diphosphate-sugar epimerase
MDLNDKRILVLGSSGLVGRAVVERLNGEYGVELLTPASSELDLLDQKQAKDHFTSHSPDAVIVAAAKVGGIAANDKFRAEFLYENLMIAANAIHSAHISGVKKLIFLGSSCIYPKDAAQPISEEALLSGPLESTNEPYAVAKIAGLKLCENYFKQFGNNFFSLMPTNLYGPNDNFDPETSHVIPGLMGKFHRAVVEKKPSVSVWGSGKPRREFMHVRDLADAVVFALKNIDAADIFASGISHLNVGTGSDISIHELCGLLAEICEFDGEMEFDTSRPDGTMRKLMDSRRFNSLGWVPKISLKEGLEETYRWYTAEISRSAAI